MGQIKRRGDVWWIRYYRGGRRFEESTHSDKWADADRLLKLREGDVAKGLPITPKVGRLRFDEAADDVVTDYRINGKRSLDDLQRRFALHLTPFFGGRRMATITTADVRTYIAQRQADGASNGTVNRELTALKRAFSLSLQAGKLLARPHIPMLRESNARTGFFEREQFESVRAHLPPALQPVVTFAYVTGWRIDSEILPLEWRHVDLAAGEVRLEPGSTKNQEGRVFPLTSELRAAIGGQRTLRDQFAQQGLLCPWVFFRLVGGRGGRRPKVPKQILRFNKAWKKACLAAGLPGKIPHDFRRTAIRNMVRRGIPERVAMQMTGHLTRSVFERYNIVSPSDLTDAQAKLEGLGAGLHSQASSSKPQRRMLTVSAQRTVGGRRQGVSHRGGDRPTRRRN